jgi:hypothetical protein
MSAVKRTSIITMILAAALAFVTVAAADIIELKVNLTNATCTTTSSNQLNCSGQLTGLGSQTADVTVTSGFACTNRGGNNPPGQVSGTQSGIKPDKNGNASFNVTTSGASCPDQMTPVFTGTAACPGQAQIDVTQVFSNRTKTTTFCVPIT